MAGLARLREGLAALAVAGSKITVAPSSLAACEVIMSRDPKSSYYDAGGIETLDIIKAKLTTEQYQGYLLGNVIKYACRANFKGCAARDSEKLAVYAKQLSSLGDDNLSA